MGNGVYVEIEVVDFYLSLKADSPAGEVTLPRVRANCVISSSALRVSDGNHDLIKGWVNRCALHLQTTEAARGTEVVSGLNGLFFSTGVGGSFPSDLKAEVYLYVDQAMFDKLVQDMQREGSKCLISFKTDEADFALKSGFQSMRINDVECRFQTTLLPGKTSSTASTDEYERVVDESCLPNTGYGSLLRNIGSELTLSLARGRAVPTSYELDRFAELMDRLKRGFHPYFLGNGLPDGLFQKDPAGFEKAVADFPDKEKSALRASYSMVWLHTPMNLVADKGEGNTALAKNHLEPNQEVIEELGEMYCSNPNLVSPSLEWAIVDSLMYSETLAFLRTLAEENRNLSRSKPFGGVSLKTQLFEQATHTLGRVVKEVITWAVTGVAANLISDASGIAPWPIFLGITAVRWVRPKKDYKAENTFEQLKLAAGMSSAYSKLSESNFNAGALLARLHALEVQGAAFKSTVYNVLEKRRARVSQ